MHFPLLHDLLIILGFSVLVVFLFQRLRLPSILGFLATGMLIGPTGLSLINAVEEIEVLAEIGVVLLLFVIGLELSLKQLVSIRKTVFLGGALQVGLTVGVTLLVAYLLGFTWPEAVFIGFLFSLSSTAIVLKILQERNEISTPHGRNALGILIFQDLIVVPMMLVTPILAGQSTDVGYAIFELVVKSFLVVLFTLLSARYLMPKVLFAIARTNSKELFLLATITFCFGVAWITSEIGLSLALGAFLAGLIISESEYSYQATSIILPFRELFTSFFFVSIGMLLDFPFFLAHAWVILGLALMVFLIKGALAGLAAILLRYPPKTVVLTGLALFQVGEFAFILSKVGIGYGLLSPEMNQYFLAVSIVTMLATPFVFMYSESFVRKFVPKSIQEKWRGALPEIESADDFSSLENHLVIIGFGLNGKNVSRAAEYSKIPYVIIESNADRVRREKAKGLPIIFGDGSQDHILESVAVHQARVVVIAISDREETKAIITHIRAISSGVFIIVRTRYVKEIIPLLAMGADEVIPEEFETSIEIFSRVLHNYLVPVGELEHLIHVIRSDNYRMFQAQSPVPRTISSSKVPAIKISCVEVQADGGDVVGKTIAAAEIRKRYGVSILAISRKNEMIHSIMPGEKILQHDLVYISGDPEHTDLFFEAVS